MADEALETTVKSTTKATSKGKTLQTEFDLVDLSTNTKYVSGHVFEGEVPAFIEAQIHFGVAKLV
jgi:hypothetical protein